MQGIKAPDPIAEQQFCELVNTYQTALLRMCYLCLQDRTLAEDAVQETFIKVWKSYSTYRGECSEKTWIMRIAVNTCRDMQRSWWAKHISRRVTLDTLELTRGTEGISEEAMLLNNEIASLPLKLREVILLYYYQNMQVNEIAKALEIAPSSVSSRLKRAKDKLRVALKGAYFDE